MRKVAKILYLAGGIVSIVVAACLFSCAVICVVFSLPILEELAAEVYNHIPGAVTIDMEDAVLAIRISLIITAVELLVFTVFSALNAVFSFKGRKVEEKSMFIKCIVFSVLGFNTLTLVASILSLIAHTREENKKAAIEESK